MTLAGIYYGFIEQLLTLKSLYEYPDLTRYIIGVAFISDAASSAGSAAVLIGTDVLHLSLVMIGAAAVVGILSAILGLFLYRFLNDKFNFPPKLILICNIVILCLMGVYALYITNLAGVFIICVVAGLQIGAFGAFSRSMISKFLPTKKQSRFFSLYDLTQKGSSWLGPLAIGGLTQIYGDHYYLHMVVYVTLVEAAIGLPFLISVNVKQAEVKRIEVDMRDEGQITVLPTSPTNIVAISVIGLVDECDSENKL